MSEIYRRPSIVRVGNPLYAKHGSTSQTYPHIRGSIEGIAVQDLVSQYGSPLFVYSERVLRQKYQNISNAFKEVYPKVQFGWSYKTNYLNAICQVFHQEGAWAEVVSHFEYEKAKNLKVPGNKIIYNGPFKPLHSLKKAVQEKSIINVDHFAEIEDLEQLALEFNQKIGLGVRVNLDCGIYPAWSRFGFNLENGQALAAVRRIVQSKSLTLQGIHFHIGTFILDNEAYGRALNKLKDFIISAESLSGANIQYLDIGGGFPSLGHLKGIYQPPEIAVPPIEDYAKIIGKSLKWILNRKEVPSLFIESGRYLVDEAGFLITQVVSDKLLPDGRRSYVLDAGVNLLYTSSWYKFKVELDQEVSDMMVPSILNGPLCMNIDIVDDAIMLPRLKRYQNLILSPVGAYNITQSMQFIQYRPAVVLIRENGTTQVIKKAENLEDINRGEALL